MSKLLRIHPADNVLIVREPIVVGTILTINDQPVKAEIALSFGNKVASSPIQRNEQVIKFGIPIGSATQDIAPGEHVHLHNMKSDYLPTYTMTDEFIAK